MVARNGPADKLAARPEPPTGHHLLDEHHCGRPANTAPAVSPRQPTFGRAQQEEQEQKQEEQQQQQQQQEEEEQQQQQQQPLPRTKPCSLQPCSYTSFLH